MPNYVDKKSMSLSEVFLRLWKGEVLDFIDASYHAEYYSVGDLRDLGLTQKITEVNCQKSMTVFEFEKVIADITIKINGEKLSKGQTTWPCEVDVS